MKLNFFFSVMFNWICREDGDDQAKRRRLHRVFRCDVDNEWYENRLKL